MNKELILEIDRMRSIMGLSTYVNNISTIIENRLLVEGVLSNVWDDIWKILKGMDAAVIRKSFGTVDIMIETIFKQDVFAKIIDDISKIHAGDAVASKKLLIEYIENGNISKAVGNAYENTIQRLGDDVLSIKASDGRMLGDILLEKQVAVVRAYENLEGALAVAVNKGIREGGFKSADELYDVLVRDFAGDLKFLDNIAGENVLFKQLADNWSPSIIKFTPGSLASLSDITNNLGKSISKISTLTWDMIVKYLKKLITWFATKWKVYHTNIRAIYQESLTKAEAKISAKYMKNVSTLGEVADDNVLMDARLIGKIKGSIRASVQVLMDGISFFYELITVFAKRVVNFLYSLIRHILEDPIYKVGTKMEDGKEVVRWWAKAIIGLIKGVRFAGARVLEYFMLFWTGWAAALYDMLNNENRKRILNIVKIISYPLQKLKEIIKYDNFNPDSAGLEIINKIIKKMEAIKNQIIGNSQDFNEVGSKLEEYKKCQLELAKLVSLNVSEPTENKEFTNYLKKLEVDLVGFNAELLDVNKATEITEDMYNRWIKKYNSFLSQIEVVSDVNDTSDTLDELIKKCQDAQVKITEYQNKLDDSTTTVSDMGI